MLVRVAASDRGLQAFRYNAAWLFTSCACFSKGSCAVRGKVSLLWEATYMYFDARRLTALLFVEPLGIHQHAVLDDAGYR